METTVEEGDPSCPLIASAPCTGVVPARPRLPRLRSKPRIRQWPVRRDDLTPCTQNCSRSSTRRTRRINSTKILNAPLWDDFEDLLGEAMRACPPVFFYLDGVDEEFSSAPLYWLQCQKGLFYEVMALLRDTRLGGKLHIVVSIRDIVFSSILRSEHAPRYIGEPHIRLLNWTDESLYFFLERKLEALGDEYFASGPPDVRSCETWLGCRSLDGEPDRENVADYLLRHTRLIPRDVVSLGNALCAESRVVRQTRAGMRAERAASRCRVGIGPPFRRLPDGSMQQPDCR